AVWAAPVGPGEHVAWRTAQALGPEDGGGVEYEVAFGAGVDGGGPLLRAGAADPGGAAGEDFEAGDVGGRVAVVFPADQAGDAVAFFHAGACENPVVGFEGDPVAAAVDGLDVAGADEVAFVGAALGEGAVITLAQL